MYDLSCLVSLVLKLFADLERKVPYVILGATSSPPNANFPSFQASKYVHNLGERLALV